MAFLPAYFIDVLSSSDRYDIVKAYAALMMCITVVCGVASRLFTGLFVRSYKKLPPSEKWDWDTRIGSSIHAAASTLLGIYVVCKSGVITGMGGPLVGPPSVWNSPLTHAGAGLSLGYFIADTFALFYYYPQLPHTHELIIHHGACLACLFVAIFSRTCHLYIEVMVLTEVTTPFINIRWFLEKAGMKRSAAYLYNGLTIVVLWFFGRICLFPPFLAHLWVTRAELTTQTPFIAWFLCVSCPIMLTILNIMWFGQIVRGAIKLLKRQGEKGEEEGAAKKAQ